MRLTGFDRPMLGGLLSLLLAVQVVRELGEREEIDVGGSEEMYFTYKGINTILKLIVPLLSK